MDVRYTHEGLVQRTFRPASRKHAYSRQVFMRLPLFLTVPLWCRHQYNLADIRQTLEEFSSKLLWQCALLFGISASNSAIKVAFATDESMVYSSKKIAIKKIEKFLKKLPVLAFSFRPSAESRIDESRNDHMPLIPIHVVQPTFQAKIRNLALRQPLSTLRTNRVPGTFEWKSIRLVCVKEGMDGALTCQRVVRWETYAESGRNPRDCIIGRPLRMCDPEGRLFALVEETMVFTTAPRHLRGRRTRDKKHQPKKKRKR